MTPDIMLQQYAIAMERWQTIWIITAAVMVLVGLAFNGLVLYLTFGRVLIPLTRSLCNFLDAQAWHFDHQYKARPAVADKPADSRYMPKS